jgi:glycerol-3-phosphate O-acyltransferase
VASSVTLPLWLVIAAGLLAAWSVLDRLLIPSVRWMLRRRLNRAIDDLNTRLKLRIQPFKLARRGALIDQLIFDPEVLHAIEEHAARTGVPRQVAQDKARRYAREIVPSFSASTYFGVGTRLARLVSRMLYRVKLGYADEAALRAVDPRSAVVFVINHRSNMDYVLVTYLASTTTALSYAVGEWARVWLLQSLIRAMGAYFVRRDSSEPLYRKVLARYVHMATAAGVTQAMFPEGGLTRDGRLRPAKLGLFSYMVGGFDPNGPRDVVFIPVGLNYDRVLEDRVQTAAIDTPAGEKPRFKFNALVLMGFIARNIWLKLTGRWYRFGYACVRFGAPISLREHLAAGKLDLRTLPPEARAAEIERLGGLLLERVGDVVPVVPVALVAAAIMQFKGAPVAALELKGRVQDLIEVLERTGHHVLLPREDREYAIDVGLRMLTLRHMVLEEDGLYRINPQERKLVAYYANSIAQQLPEGGIGFEPMPAAELSLPPPQTAQPGRAVAQASV